MTHPIYSLVDLKLHVNFVLLLLHLQEVGSIIGKKGEIVKRFRDEVSFIKSEVGNASIENLELDSNFPSNDISIRPQGTSILLLL